MVRSLALESDACWGPMLALSLICCVTLGKLPGSSEPHFIYLLNEMNSVERCHV